MTNPAFDTDDEKPLDPAVEKVRRKMIRFMGINLGLLFVALMAVVGAIVYKSRIATPTTAEPQALAVPAGAPLEGTIALPKGARVLSQSLSGDKISLLVEEAAGTQAIYVFDLGSNRMAGRFEIAPN
ncbi:MAG: fimbrial protein [Rhizobiaceae bacterium]|nr:fimbrial protein [Rhizobiaceae bacterium]